MAKAVQGSAQVTVMYGQGGSAITARAARELADGLGEMLGQTVAARADSRIRDNRIIVAPAPSGQALAASSAKLAGDAFEITRPAPDAVSIHAGHERGLLHAAVDMLTRLGAVYPPGVAPRFPRVEAGRLFALTPCLVTPAFSRRALVSDILTWNYEVQERFEQHLEFDREFIPWMARRGINRFEYIRHGRDTRLRIDELVALYGDYGIESEYGGHVLQLLMPRERFDSRPEYFPLGSDGKRNPHGNLCVSNSDAVRLVAQSALAWMREYPENRMLHVWGADVLKGAWCNCSECKSLSPQLQYMKVINAIAAAAESASAGVPIAYLAYHDTLEPDAELRPLDNVHFEWAPRERCYVHAIDDSSCSANARYYESLKRYIDIFRGRGQVFEYYADAILFGGLAFAMPSIITRDLRAYRALGIDSVSCLTFGAYSVLAYPVNLETFVRAACDPRVDPARTLSQTAAGRHPGCAEAMEKAYRAIEGVAALMLDYADVMAPYTITGRRLGLKKAALPKALEAAQSAVRIAEGLAAEAKTPLTEAEAELWNYGLEVISAIGDYLRAREERGIVRKTLGDAAVGGFADAIEHIRAIAPELKGTWGAYDLEWIREMWLDGLRRNLAEGNKVREGA
jgi:hypothetical protein